MSSRLCTGNRFERGLIASIYLVIPVTRLLRLTLTAKSVFLMALQAAPWTRDLRGARCELTLQSSKATILEQEVRK